MLNELLLKFALWLDTFQSSTDLHESLYMYGWVESTHVLTLMLFLGMLLVIDLRLLGVAFKDVPASRIVERLDKPMMLGFVVMVISGALLFYAIPVRSTQSVWFRIKVVLLIAGVNALLIRNMTRSSTIPWDNDPIPPRRIRIGAGLSLGLWTLVIGAGRSMAYDWWDCSKADLPYFMYWAAGCVNEIAALEQ